MASSVQTSHEIYRQSSLGIALMDSLDDLIQSGHINPQLAHKVLQQFDKSLSSTFSRNLKCKTTMKAHLHHYRLCDEVWTFVVKDCTLKLETEAGLENVKVATLKVVACPGAKEK